jgi:4-hydroxymandelate oxidase
LCTGDGRNDDAKRARTIQANTDVSDPLTISVPYPIDFEDLARARLPTPVWNFVVGGAGAELTVAANSRAFDEHVRIVPRVLVDVSVCDTATVLLGAPLAMPVGIAPTAYQNLVHPEGEIGVARAAGAAGALCVVSIFAGQRLADIAAAARGPLWLQVYWLRRREVLADLIHRAEECGYQAVVLTVDAPRLGQRLRTVRDGFELPPEITAVNLDEAVMAMPRRAGTTVFAAHAETAFDPAVTWADLAWLRATTRLPVLVKGVLSPDDAELAVAHGAAGIIVSNHGGRQVDGAVASLHALPGIVAAVAGRCPVLLDGGVRRGRDVFVARALGADAVLLGRGALWALAAAGGAGVQRLLTLVREELVNLMAISGRPRLADLDRSAVRLGGGWSDG